MLHNHKILIEASLDDFASIINQELVKAMGKFIPVNEQKEYLTKPQVAELLQVTERTVDNWSKVGLLHKYEIGNQVRFIRKEVEDAFSKI